MVLCQFYLNNNCRFGSKCVNEHFDVKQLIKTEVEAAVKGTQWPLSCFGPFKEKPCLTNFINDQSFEEIRYLCYEAKKQNNLQAYAQQFTQEVMGAQNRMKALLSLSRDVVDAVVNLYNSQDPNATQQGQTSNPFAMGGGGAGFGQPQTNNANSLFGASNAAPANPFANSGFGGVPAQSTVGIFGGTTTTTVAGSSLFAQQPSFGANTFGAPNASIFGGTQTQPQQQQQQQPQQLGAFALPQIGGNQQPNQPTSPFGMPPQPQNAFGNQTGSVFATQNPTPQTGLFGQQTTQIPSQNGLFGQTNAQQQQPQQQVPGQNIGFGQQTVVPPSTGLFGQSTVGSGQSIFGGNTAMTPQQQQTPFGGQIQMQQPQQQQSQIGFGMQQSGIFGSPQMQQQQQQQMQQQQPIQHQQQPAAALASGGLFGSGGQANAFQQNMAQGFGAQNTMGQIPTYNSSLSDTTYSRMEDLTPEELEAFRAPEFILGKMPTVPPPRELC